MHFTKLHAEIIHSSIWDQPSDICKVWITMLAMANWHGEVRASVPGLAVAARVSRETCERALAIFLGPDPDSRDGTTGERITKIDGGWHVINHEKYRDFRTPTQVRKAEAMARYRAKKRGDDDADSDDDHSRQSDPCRDHVVSTHLISSSSSEDGEHERKGRTRSKPAVKKPDDVDQQHWDDWLTVRRSKRVGTLTATAWGLVTSEAAVARMEIPAVVRTMAERQWASFKAEWVTTGRDGKPKPKTYADRCVKLGDPEEDWPV